MLKITRDFHCFFQIVELKRYRLGFLDNPRNYGNIHSRYYQYILQSTLKSYTLQYSSNGASLYIWRPYLLLRAYIFYIFSRRSITNPTFCNYVITIMSTGFGTLNIIVPRLCPSCHCFFQIRKDQVIYTDFQLSFDNRKQLRQKSQFSSPEREEYNFTLETRPCLD